MCEIFVFLMSIFHSRCGGTGNRYTVKRILHSILDFPHGQKFEHLNEVVLTRRIQLFYIGIWFCGTLVGTSWSNHREGGKQKKQIFIREEDNPVLLLVSILSPEEQDRSFLPSDPKMRRTRYSDLIPNNRNRNQTDGYLTKKNNNK